ncbi:hypothetical protein EG68_02507 [Paragonimus skrjabini miyazakii]|uniref:Uncharacterized protein n=1 Tax=Paragonimus skrjabini miyazakii TaxID=59628 RepID=A0A8S9ZA91_9TREM|nr:hypothetical protein EG68_02507 [Paragonimus skrjabini miyazakii]
MAAPQVKYDPLRSENFRQWVMELIQALQMNKLGDLRLPDPSICPLSCHFSPYSQTIPNDHFIAQNTAKRTELGERSQPNQLAVLPHPACPDLINHPIIAAQTYSLPPVNSEATATVKLPPVCRLFSWCPVDVQPDGDCRLAGFYKIKPGEPFHYVRSAFIASVSDNGRSVSTIDGQTYLLHKNINWWIYLADTDKPDMLTLPPNLEAAFCCGFPSKQWRCWTQGLYYFLSTAQLSSIESDQKRTLTPAIHPSRPRNIPGNSETAEPRTIPNPYDHILSSYQPTVDLDFRNTEVDAHLNIEAAALSEESFQNPASPSASNVTSFSERALSPARHSPRKVFRKQTGKYSSKLVQGHSKDNKVSKTDARKPRHHENHTMSPTMTSSTFSSEDSMDLRRDPSFMVKTSGPPTQKRVSVAVHSRKASEPVKNFSLHTTKQHRRSAPAQDKKIANGVSKEHSRPQRNNLPLSNKTVDDKFRIYTADGKTVDTRELEQTRSGRWVIPRLDRRYGQTLQLRKNGTLQVSHDSHSMFL